MKNKPLIQKISFALGLLVFPFLFLTSNTSAATLGTSSFALNYIPPGSSSYTTKGGILYGYGQATSTNSANWYQIDFAPVAATGNYASIHFETNVVATDWQIPRRYQWVNLPYIKVSTCTASNSTIEIVQSSIATAITPWENTGSGGQPLYNSTLTVYGDIAIKGLNSGTSNVIRCIIGNSNYAFFSGVSYTSFPLWFEANPASIEFSNNINDALLQMQVNQNDVMINNQVIIAEGVGQTTDAVNNLHDWMADDTPANVDTSVLGNSVGWLPAGPVDSILTLPLTLLRGIVGVFTNTSCTPLSIPVPFVNSNIELPCVSTLMDQVGFTPVWSLVGGVISAVIIWQTLKWLYKFVDDTLTFRENNSGMWGGL